MHDNLAELCRDRRIRFLRHGYINNETGIQGLELEFTYDNTYYSLNTDCDDSNREEDCCINKKIAYNNLGSEGPPKVPPMGIHISFSFTFSHAITFCINLLKVPLSLLYKLSLRV